MNYFSNRYKLDGNKLKRADNLKTSFKKDKINAEKLRNALLGIVDAAKIVYPDDYQYYVYYLGDKPRFVFVTTEVLNLADLESTWGERKYPWLVEGALYDLKYERFVIYPKAKPKNEYFYLFKIYDGGVPNIVCAGDNSFIFYLNGDHKDSYCFDEYCIISRVVVHLQEEKGIITRKRVMFYRDMPPEGLTDRMLVLDHDVMLNKKDKDVSYVECLYDSYCRKGDRAMIHFFGLGIYNDFGNVKHDVWKGDPTRVELIGGSSCVVVKTNYGESGDYVFILLHRGTTYDYKYSCFKYERVEPTKEGYVGHIVIREEYEKNDIDNGVDYFDITDRKFYNEAEFKRLCES